MFNWTINQNEWSLCRFVEIIRSNSPSYKVHWNLDMLVKDSSITQFQPLHPLFIKGKTKTYWLYTYWIFISPIQIGFFKHSKYNEYTTEQLISLTRRFEETSVVYIVLIWHIISCLRIKWTYLFTYTNSVRDTIINRFSSIWNSLCTNRWIILLNCYWTLFKKSR